MTATNAHGESLAIALAHAARGRAVFPLVDKRPAVSWQRPHEASSDPDRVRRLWKAHPQADGAGWRVPTGLVVLDIDDPEGFAALVPSLPDAPGQRSRLGEHLLFTDPGVVQGRVAKVADLKVGGKGYVKLYEADGFDGEPPELPAEVVQLRETAMPKPAALDADEPMGSRDELLSFAGRLRRAGADADDILAAMLARLADGRIVSLDESQPWTERDLRAIAADIGSKPIGDEARYEQFGQRLLESIERWKERRLTAEPAAMSLVTVSASDLLSREYRPLVEPVPGLVAEGLNMLIGGPKMGKSWLAYQMAVAVATGGEVLGRRADRGDVLYLALEDGERRAQSRIRTVLRHLGQAWPADGSALDIAFDAEKGDEVVSQIEEWIAARPKPALVIVDTLQKIRPRSSGKRNQYELDVEDLGRVLAVTQRHPGLAVLLVHHDRKQQADDFLDSASGTHGITGSVDVALVLRRARHETQATLDVTGRDIREGKLFLAYDGDDPFWTIDPKGGLTENQVKAWEFVRAHGPMGPTAIGEHLGMDKSNVSRMLKELVMRRVFVSEDGRYRLPLQPMTTATTEDNDDNSDNEDHE